MEVMKSSGYVSEEHAIEIANKHGFMNQEPYCTLEKLSKRTNADKILEDAILKIY